MSFGTTLGGAEYVVGYEGGSVSTVPSTVNKMANGGNVTANIGTVTTVIDGKEEAKEVEDEGTGVKPEIRVWGEALAAGKSDHRQSPEEALADLEIMECMFRSGEQGGAPQQCKFQTSSA